jgi:alginate O-acetyltransferase complex protein AlgI
LLFNSLAFVCFLPLFMIAYWSTKGRLRLWVMLAGSLVFYAWWDWRFCFLLLFSALVDYSLGILLENEQDDAMRRRLIIISVVVNLGLLGFFKYFNFFVQSFTPRETFDVMKIVLPVGISFYVFKTMSYTIDVYRRTQAAERDLLRFTTFVVFFPELVAGPIVRASRLLPQLARDHRFDYQRMVSGVTLIASGYVRKVAIADSIAPLVDIRFAHPEAHNAWSLLIGVYLYAFQIYCDFSGYSSIAIGLARILGFDFGVNFDRPYFSASFSEFWTRWHISLSSWLRDYLYIPLGGSRGGKWRTYRNLMITMLLGGLWHGASWTFVFWGALHGSYLVIERVLSEWGGKAAAFKAALTRRTPKVLLIIIVFHLTCFAWVFFRAHSFSNAWEVLSGIASMRGSLADVENRWRTLKCAVMIAVMLGFEAVAFVPKWRTAEISPAMRLAFVAVCAWVVLIFGTFSGNNFIYFQF